MIALALRYGPTLAVALTVGAGVWYVVGLRADNHSLNDENAALAADLRGCVARQADISEHRERSNEINNLSADDLRKRALDWMRGTSAPD